MGERPTPVGDASPEPCAECRQELAEYQQLIRRTQREVQSAVAAIEAKAVRLDAVDYDLRMYAGLPNERPEPSSGPRRRGSIRSRGREIAASTLKADERGDGFFEIRIDTLPPFDLPPMLGRLLQLLAEQGGHDAGDGLVGFKSNGYLITKLDEFSRQRVRMKREPGPRVKRLNQALMHLRRRLATITLEGDALVQTRRGVGFRFALRRPAVDDLIPIPERR